MSNPNNALTVERRFEHVLNGDREPNGPGTGDAIPAAASPMQPPSKSTTEFVLRMIQLGVPKERVISALVAATTPQPHDSPPDLRAVADAVRGGRETVAAMLSEVLVGDRLAADLGDVPGTRDAVNSLLNPPFPARTEISKEFLDLVVARQQRQDWAFRLLAELLVELHWPSDRGLPEYVCESSTKGRRR